MNRAFYRYWYTWACPTPLLHFVIRKPSLYPRTYLLRTIVEFMSLFCHLIYTPTLSRHLGSLSTEIIMGGILQYAKRQFPLKGYALFASIISIGGFLNGFVPNILRK